MTSHAGIARRGYLGLQPGDDPSGVAVAAALDGGPAARAGVRVGDLIDAIDGTSVRTPGDLRASLASVRAGAAVTLSLRGRGELVVRADARPVEQYPGLTVRLGAATSGFVRLRTIGVMPPGDGPFATVLFLQGYSCGTIERPASPPARDALRGLVEALARAGLAVWRVDKRGVGDSEGPSATDGSFDDERSDFAAALRAVRDDPSTDRRRVALFGHSLGALHAPVIAREGRATAMVLYGAGSRTWLEYLDANTRRQCALAEVGAARTEALVRARQRFFHAVLIEGRGVEAVIGDDAELAAMRGSLGVDAQGRIDEHREVYWRGVQACPVARPLLDAALPTLAMWGSADWLTAREEHEELAAIANEARPGGGRFAAIDGADHGFFAHADARTSWRARWTGALHGAVADETARWLRACFEATGDYGAE